MLLLQLDRQTPQVREHKGGPPNMCPVTERDKITQRKQTEKIGNILGLKNSSIEAWNVIRNFEKPGIT